MSDVSLRQIYASFGEHFQLQDINWTIEPGQHWVLLGPNGAGKSALAALLAGDGEITAGEIEGTHSNMGVVSFEAQERLIDAELKLDDADILDVISEGTPAGELLRRDCRNSELRERLIERFALRDKLERSFRKLSTGETRKILIIKALCSQPSRLLLDEPFEGLDHESCLALLDELTALSEYVPMILVLNRLDEIPAFVTHVGYLEQGKLLHKVGRSDTEQLQEVEQLLHLKTADLNLPKTDPNHVLPPLDPTAPLVRMRELKVAYGEQVIFEGLNWTIEKGQHWQVTGANGSGKTCLLNLITGDHPQCYVNDIFVFGMQRGNGESIWQIKQYIGYVSSALQWEYRVSASVKQVIISGFFDSIGVYQKASEAQQTIAEQWLRLLGMEHRASESFSQLSFGDRRLVLIARAMVKSPPLLILDEPCLGLDDINRQLVLALIEKICASDTSTVLYVNHRPADQICGIDKHLALTTS
ncbi:MAG: molybdate ABC transporter ATP-binding protein ModF [Granulosicoccaceae bacterium]